MAEKPFAGSVIKVDTVVVALVNSVARAGSTQIVDVTGAENVSGELSITQRKVVSREYSLELGGVIVTGSPSADLEAGQAALRTAFEAGTAVVLQTLDADGWGQDDTSLITALNIQAAVGDVYRFTCSLVVNSSATVAGS